MSPSPSIRGIADTARWVALYRAEESERNDALFRDPWARALAGQRGAQIAKELPRSARKAGWSFVARTVLFDQIIQDAVAAGTKLVINLAAGMDTRPYRLPLPSTLRWIEVDQAEILSEKAAMLASAQPRCQLERVSQDLAVEDARKRLFQQSGSVDERALVLTEGLLPYLTEAQVTTLARDLAEAGLRTWATDLTSPGLQRMIQRDWGRHLAAAGASLQFAPMAGPDFFAALGWLPVEVHPILPTAGRLKRLPLFLRLLTLLVGMGTFHPQRPWSAVCLLKRPTPARPAT